MSYKIKNAIIKWDRNAGKFDLVDPEGYFRGKEILVAIDGDDLITIQLLVNAIVKNDFKNWKEIHDKSPKDSIKNLLLKLGYEKDEIARMLREF
jgi:SOS response regulatory protein OraA/RecX